jgi:arsenite-transporting ATPase
MPAKRINANWSAKPAVRNPRKSCGCWSDYAIPPFTHILLLTLPEATPVHEAAALQDDLRRAHIEPFAWVINQSLLHSGSCDPLLQRREESEHRYISEVVAKHATRTAWLPWQPEEPIGPVALVRLASSKLQTAMV